MSGENRTFLFRRALARSLVTTTLIALSIFFRDSSAVVIEFLGAMWGALYGFFSISYFLAIHKMEQHGFKSPALKFFVLTKVSVFSLVMIFFLFYAPRFFEWSLAGLASVVLLFVLQWYLLPARADLEGESEGGPDDRPGRD